MRVKQYAARRLELLSLVGGHLGLASSLIISIGLYSSTHSALVATFVFGLPWLIPLLWPNGVYCVVSRGDICDVARRADWINAGLTLVLICALYFQSYLIMVPAIIAKGFFEMVGRTACTLIAKQKASTPSQVEKDITLIELYRTIGTSSAGLTVGMLDLNTNILWYAGIIAACYFISGTQYKELTLDGWNAIQESNSRVKGPVLSLNALCQEQPTAMRWMILLGILTAFQGLHNALRVAYPVQVLSLGTTGVGIVSAVSTIGILTGGIAIKRSSASIQIIPLFLITVAFLSAAMLIKVPEVSLASYFMFMVAFEFAFVFLQAKFVGSISSQFAAQFLSWRVSILGASALGGLALTSVAISVSSPPTGAIAVSIMLLFAVVAVLNKKIQNAI